MKNNATLRVSMGWRVASCRRISSFYRGGNELRRMDAPLSNCAIEQRAVVRFLWTEGIISAQIHCRTLAENRARTMNQWKMYQCVERFKSGKKRNGRKAIRYPSASRAKEHIQRVGCFDQRRPMNHVRISGGNRDLQLQNYTSQRSWWFAVA